MTVLVIALQLSADELDSMMPSLRPPLVKMSEIYSSHRTRLVKPAIYFSDSGVVLSYVPCAGEITDGEAVDHQYTFLHLQRDLFELGHEHGIAISAQKPPGSCYMTLGRFVKGEDPGSNTKLDPAAIALWVAGVKKINEVLRREYWPADGSAPEAGNWVIGDAEGLDIRKGASWYGGGESLSISA
ncbi:hypothetical protein IF1G_06452 [Cordyceps javanica]|uniref:Uncharacterized protein n=1 Tax=Cordyceps javanica TaxID=43265 RepID=A0A545UYA0_9HYPO|nr:hypothetical protein IF1G_06452 [Cordyceps javanica]TQW06307.1 hypothetical protein IF2G_05729 [Cordyceps javanica]